MKRIAIILWVLSISYQIANAQPTKFKLTTTNFKEGELIGSLYNFQDHKFWAILGIPTEKKGKEQLYNYSMTQFNNEFEQLNRLKLPKNKPTYSQEFIFGNYIVFNGANDKALMNSTRKENIILFTDREFNPVKEVNRMVNNLDFRFTDDFKLFLSEDSTKLISIAFVNENVGKISGQKLKAFIEVYDLKLEVIWQKSFYTSKYLGNDPKAIQCLMLNNNKIVIITADKEGSSSKLRVCIFNDEESDPRVSSFTFEYPIISFKHYLRNSETIVMGGTVSNSDYSKEMFYLEYSLDKNDFGIQNIIKLDKSFASHYPDISKPLNHAYPVYPLTSDKTNQNFMPWGDGSLMIFDGSYYFDGIYFPCPIAFMAINSEGQIKWIKLIPRLLKTMFYDFATYSVYKNGDKLQIFYGADPDKDGNMKLPINPRVMNSGIGLFYSELDVNGNLSPGKLLTKSNLDEYSFSIPEMFQLDENVFVTQCKLLKKIYHINIGLNLGIITLTDK